MKHEAFHVVGFGLPHEAPFTLYVFASKSEARAWAQEKNAELQASDDYADTFYAYSYMGEAAARGELNA